MGDLDTAAVTGGDWEGELLIAIEIRSNGDLILEENFRSMKNANNHFCPKTY